MNIEYTETMATNMLIVFPQERSKIKLLFYFVVVVNWNELNQNREI